MTDTRNTLTADLTAQAQTGSKQAFINCYGEGSSLIAELVALEELRPGLFVLPAGYTVFTRPAPQHPNPAVRSGESVVIAAAGITFTVTAAELAEATR